VKRCEAEAIYDARRETEVEVLLLTSARVSSAACKGWRCGLCAGMVIALVAMTTAI